METTMTDLNERLRGIDRLIPPDLWEAAQVKAEGGLNGMRSLSQSPARRFAIIAASLAIGLAAVAWVVIAITPATSPPTPVDEPILSPAPRTDCPTGLIRADSINTQEFVRQMQGYLPTWLPEGFGLLATFGWDGSMDGSAGHGIWSDERCRKVELDFNPNWRSSGRVMPGDVRPSVGPWIVEADEPDECGNAVLGTGRCLRYSASTTEGLLTLAMMGLDRENGDRIALSIYSGPSLDVTALVSSSGPSSDTALLIGTLTAENGCLAVSTGNGSSVYVVWPAGYSLSKEKGGTWLVDDSGALVATIGDEVQMGGSITNLAHAEPEVVGGIPSSCEVGGTDAYWFAGTPVAVIGSLVTNGAASTEATRLPGIDAYRAPTISVA